MSRRPVMHPTFLLGIALLSGPTTQLTGVASAQPWDVVPIWAGAKLVPSLVVADIDSDGDNDIVACHGGSKAGLHWYENVNGLHSPWPEHTIADEGCVSIEAARLDQNNTVDLVVVADTPSTPLNIYFNDNGDATSWTYLNTTKYLAYGLQPRVSDIDKNGLRDIVTPRILFLQQPGEEFLEIPLPGNAFFATPGRINADNRVDLFVAHPAESPSVGWMENADSTGTNWELHPVLASPELSSPQDMIAADLDDDGDLDALIPARCRLQGMINPGSSGTWRVVPYFEVNETDCVFGGGLAGTAAADQNGDGRIDIATTRVSPGGVRIMLGKSPSGEFREPTSITSDLNAMPNFLAFADIDGSPPLEIVLATRDSNIFLNNGTIRILQDPGTGFCGDAALNEGEACDDGDFEYANGDGCSADCKAMPCGKPVTGSDGKPPRSSDALCALRSAVGFVGCALSVCDTSGDGDIAASDALAILRKAVNLPVVLSCPPWGA